VELAKGADLYVTETTSPEDVIALYKENGIWQAKSPSEQEGFLRHMHEEHVTPEDIGRMAAKAGVKAVVMTHIGPTIIPNDDFQRYVDEAKKAYHPRQRPDEVLIASFAAASGTWCVV
jgi:ribonuclease BN (tRNA processing enzyme)